MLTRKFHSFVLLPQRLCLSHPPSFPFCEKRKGYTWVILGNTHTLSGFDFVTRPSYKHNNLFLRSSDSTRSRSGVLVTSPGFACDNDILTVHIVSSRPPPIVNANKMGKNTQNISFGRRLRPNDASCNDLHDLDFSYQLHMGPPRIEVSCNSC